jgi:hypothetical protein
MDLMESSTSSDQAPSAPPLPTSSAPLTRGRSQSTMTLFTLPDNSTIRLHFESARDRSCELVLDRSEILYYVIDNSGSMGSTDGK